MADCRLLVQIWFVSGIRQALKGGTGFIVMLLYFIFLRGKRAGGKVFEQGRESCYIFKMEELEKILWKKLYLLTGKQSK